MHVVSTSRPSATSYMNLFWLVDPMKMSCKSRTCPNPLLVYFDRTYKSQNALNFSPLHPEILRDLWNQILLLLTVLTLWHELNRYMYDGPRLCAEIMWFRAPAVGMLMMYMYKYAVLHPGSNLPLLAYLVLGTRLFCVHLSVLSISCSSW